MFSSLGIGSATVEALLTARAKVTSLDINPPRKPTRSGLDCQWIHCDISDESALKTAFDAAIQRFGPIACCIALASLDFSVLPHHGSLCDMEVEQWRRTHKINVEGTFLTSRQWLRQPRDHAVTLGEGEPRMDNVSLIIVGSESGHFGERGNADYGSGKSAVQIGLVKSLMGDVARIWPGAR